MKQFYFIIVLYFVLVSGNSQTAIDLNEPGFAQTQELNEQQRSSNAYFESARRARPFRLNSQIRSHQNIQPGNQINLQLFEDVSHQATVLRKATDVNGVTAITLKLNAYQHAYAYLALSPGSYLVTVDIPEENQKYSSRTNLSDTQTYMFQLDETEFQNLKCGVDDEAHTHGYDGGGTPQVPGGNNPFQGVPIDSPGLGPLNESCVVMPGTGDPANITLMIVYTPAAEDWSNTNEGGILNTINATMAHLNQTAIDNNLGITFDLVYSGLVNYTEVSSGGDLNALRDPNDGQMDEVHDIRRDFEADMVSILTYFPGDGIGGIAYLLTSQYGSPQTAFSLTKVNAASSTSTFTHELGHNMGAMHNLYQASDPGPTVWSDWPENTWSAGWRWEVNTNYYADLMSYGGVSEYPDGMPTIRLPIFSDPTYSHLGEPAGHPDLADNARTLREVKHIVTGYREAIQYCRAEVSIPTAFYISGVSMGDITLNSGPSLYSDYTSFATCMMPGESQILTVDVSNSASSNRLKVWVDWNDDKIFDPVNELMYESQTGSSQYTVEIIAPLGVSLDNKRMRIRVYDSNSGVVNSGPCGFGTFGEIEDYTIKLEAAPPCTEANVPQNLQAGNITANSATISWDSQLGLDHYELRYREVGAPDWETVSPIWYPYQTLTDLNFNTEYEAQVRTVCNSIPSDYTPSIEFSTTGYCPATYSGGLTITRVRIGDIDNVSSGGTGYSDFTNISTDLERGRTYNIIINNNSGGIYELAYAAYIDYNYNGTFEVPAELIWNQTSVLGSEVSGQFTVPMDASLESARLRILMLYTTNTSTIPQPCTVSGASGEVEDYTVNITPYTPCAVAAIPANMNASNISDNQATLSWEEVPGADYDVRYRISGDVDWIEINGFFENFIVLQNLNNDTDYEAQVRSVCDGTPGAYSASLMFTTNKYCNSQGGSNWNITNVTFSDINNSSPGVSQSDSYTDFTNIIGTVNQLLSYDLNITTTGGLENIKSYRVWIDFNQNGIFEASELVVDQQTASATVSQNVTIPVDALTGNTIMRVSYKFPSGPHGPCDTFGFGEVEDYTLNILPFVPCEAATVPDNLQLENLTHNQATLTWDAVPGASYDVRYRETGATEWIEVSEVLQNTITLQPLDAETQYEAQVRSVCDELTVSDYTALLIFETFSTPLVYCDAGATNTSFEIISNVTFNTINNNSTSTAGYEDFTHISTEVEKGETYPFSASFSGTSYPSDQVLVWIDFNQNGNFDDPGEQVLVTPLSTSPWQGNITIPNDALNGPTRMRVRLHDAMGGTPNATPCGNSTYGQVEDYTVVIKPSGYVFQNGSWSPENPVGVSTTNDDIYIMNGTTTLSGNLLANNLIISESATLRTTHTITVNGDIDNEGLLLFGSLASSTGQLDTFTGSINGSGEVQLERYIPARRAFRFLSSAVTTSTSINANWQEGAVNATDNPNPGFGTHITGSTTGENGFDATPSGAPSLFTLNNTTQNWIAASNTDITTISAGTPYRILIRGDRSIDVTSNSATPTNTTLRTTGVLHTGPFAVASLSENANAFNFIGNPYPAAIDMEAVLLAASNINSVHYWVWDPTLGGEPIPGQPGGRGAYVAVNVGNNTSNNPSSEANKYLQPGQAAFVQTAANGPGAINFQEQHKAVDQPQTQVFDVMSSIRMSLFDAGSFANGSTASDGLLLKFSEDGSNEINFEDAMKFYNQDENLASVNTDVLLSIESRALPEVGETISLFINQYRKTSYVFEISLNEMDNIEVFLKDHFTGTLSELSNNQTTLYAFQVDPSISASTADDRFEIIFEEVTLSSDNPLFGDGFILYPNPAANTFYIATSNIQGDEIKVKVHSITGQQVFSDKMKVPANGQIQVDIPGLNTGLYLVEVIHIEGGIFTAKLIIN